jgi:hypothetical protein
MYEYVEAGGKIDEVRETRPEWSDKHEFHFDLRLQIEGRRIYIETRLNCRIPPVPDDSTILVANIHAQ